MRALVLSTLVLALAGARAGAGEEPSVASLVEFLGDPDPYVRREAARRLVAAGDVAVTPLAVARDSRDPVRAAAATETARALTLARRLAAAKEDSVRFWLAYEDVRELAPTWLRESVYEAILADPVRRAELEKQRRSAKHAVDRFCADWNEMTPGPDSEEGQRYLILEADLKAAGTAAAPHVLRILDADPHDAFPRMDPALGITARMEVRAVFAAMYLELREALPQLLLLSEGPSLTLTSNAGSLFLRFTADETTVPFERPDTRRLLELWAKHRKECEAGARSISRRLVADLRESLAEEVVTSPDATAGPAWRPVAQKRFVSQLSLVRGEAFEFDEKAPVAKRLDQARAIADRIDELDGR